MPSRADWRSAFALCAAIIGAGFASGREIVSFFSGFGAASWLGILAASAGIALLIYVVMLLADRTHAKTLPTLYGALMGQPCQDALCLLHGLLCLTTAAAMTAAGAELGALALPQQHAREIGLFMTLLLSAVFVISGFRSLSLLGALLVPLIAAYFCSMTAGGQTASDMLSADQLTPALPMGLIYAAFNAALCGNAACLCGQSGASPKKTALLTGLLLFLLLSCANAAMLRAGEYVRNSALPSVVLSARWGIPGYYISILVLWISVLTTLCAMLHSLQTQLMESGMQKLPALLLCALGSALLSVSGFQNLVGLFYPILGWICSFVLVALLLFLPGDSESSG